MGKELAANDDVENVVGDSEKRNEKTKDGIVGLDEMVSFDVDGKNKSSGVDSQDKSHPLEKSIEKYLSNLRDIGQTVEVVAPHLAGWFSDEIDKNRNLLSKYLEKGVVREKGGLKVVIDSAREFAEINKALRRAKELTESKALDVLIKSLFVQMFCEFDAFMGVLLKNVYERKSSLMRGISREISLSDLMQFPDIEAVKRSMLEKEIETIRRESYVEQFAKLETKFSIVLRKFPEWTEFVEMGQRRNLFTHNDGMISDQYLSVCEREKVVLNADSKLGSKLKVDPEYFMRSIIVMSKVGFMLCHTLWMKVFPDENKQVHNSINDILYGLLLGNRWRAASELGKFALNDPMKKGISEIDFKIRVINVSIAHKFSGDMVAAERLLESIDWTASYRDFGLSICVIKDKFDEAITYMKSIGKSGELINQASYHEWPLFYKFRDMPDFYAAYQEIYGESYLKGVPSKTDIPGREKNVLIALEGKDADSSNPSFEKNAAEDVASDLKAVKKRKRKTVLTEI